MLLLGKLKNNIQGVKKSIVLSDGDDERTVRAAYEILHKKYVDIHVIGNKELIMPIYDSLNPTEELNVIDIETSPMKDELIQLYYDKRKNKGETLDDAKSMVKRPCFFSALGVEKGIFDGCVAGSISSTSEVLRGALKCIGLKKDINKISAFMIQETPISEFGTDGLFFQSDIAINPDPDSQTLSEIAESTADSWKVLTGIEPKVAFLSFSTKGSADSDSVLKVRKAVELLQARRPDICSDGELQFDAALIKDIGKRKAPESLVAGNANVLIFPNLDAGNIGYKITERMCVGAKATGPIIQGLAKPMNDLSRGCSWEDIVNVVVITAYQSQVL